MSSSSGSNNWCDMYLSPCIWMGNNLDDAMNEQFIKQAFQHYGEKVLSVKIIKGKKAGQQPYCFVEFDDVEQARHALFKLNGKPIPNTHPSKLFKLNPASFGKEQQLMPEFSLHIGDLTLDVDDYTLYSAFAKNYRSVRGAKVVLDCNGKSKGFGFVRFSDESDQQRALVEMQHMTGIGRRPIKVGLAAPKRSSSRSFGSHGSQSHSHDNLGPPTSYPSAPSSSSHGGGSYSSPPYSHHGGYYSWGGYYHYSHNYQNHPPPSHEYPGEGQAAAVDDMEVLEDPCLEVNVTKENREFMESSESFFEALDRSRWFAIDSIQSEVPA
ncbi:tRNA selenocysteine 1-associated protein 1-like [Babylonia areolata]|uniref:tRNA selenocysteine 1-associated protein 1-like n=1 Tax=Babylonia areolata TaxID=304850 RepID=UPI003FD270B0